MHRRPTSAVPGAAHVVAAALAFTLALPAAAQESTPPETPGTPETTAEAPAAETPPPADAKPKSGIWKGRSRVSLVGGYNFGNSVRDAGILTAPITGQPGSRDYPARAPLAVEFDDAPGFGVRYAWFAGDDWGLELGLHVVSSEIHDPDRNLAEDLRILDTETALSDADVAGLMDRLTAHTEPHDMDVTFFDISALHVFTPNKRWPVEVGGGIGWAFSSLDGPATFERLVTSDIVTPGQFRAVANELPDPDVPYGQCLAANDPCITITEQGGLTWNAYASLGYAFTPNVQLQLGGRLRFVEQLVDPGDSSVMTEVTLGMSFLFGGK